jgi:hypothetical protein
VVFIRWNSLVNQQVLTLAQQILSNRFIRSGEKAYADFKVAAHLASSAVLLAMSSRLGRLSNGQKTGCLSKRDQ